MGVGRGHKIFPVKSVIIDKLSKVVGIFPLLFRFTPFHVLSVMCNLYETECKVWFC